MSEMCSFLVRSSDGVTSYSVEIGTSDFLVVVKCSCPAGIKGKLCKHKVRLLGNDYEVLSDNLQKQELSSVLHSIRDSTALIELRQYKEAELAYKTALATFEKAKKRLEKSLKG